MNVDGVVVPLGGGDKGVKAGEKGAKVGEKGAKAGEKGAKGCKGW